MTATPQALDLIHRPGSATALLHPLRRRILEALREPDSATGLGRRLGLPRQKLNYHLRELERQFLVEVVEERRKGNCTERILRSRANSYVIDPGALGSLAADPAAIPDRFSATFLVALAARTIREVAALTHRAGKAGRRVATLSLDTEIRFASAADRNAFAAELAREVARLAAKYHREETPGGRTFRVMAGVHPAPAKSEGPGDTGGPSDQDPPAGGRARAASGPGGAGPGSLPVAESGRDDPGPPAGPRGGGHPESQPAPDPGPVDRQAPSRGTRTDLPEGSAMPESSAHELPSPGTNRMRPKGSARRKKR